MALVDERTFYFQNMNIFVGRQQEGLYELKDDIVGVVQKLIKAIDN